MTLGSSSRRVLTAGALTLGAALFAPEPVAAQGCVASRLDAGGCARTRREDDTMSSYALLKGRWEASVGYRFFRSHRHFVGSIEQDGGPRAHSDRSTTAVVNHVHIPALSVSYGVSDKLSLTAALPVLIAHRSGPPNASRPFRQHTDARGVSDLNVVGRYWLADPKVQGSQNLSFGFGIKAPTGNEAAEDEVFVSNSGILEAVRRPVDQSIQPGDGGWGFITEVQGFKAFGSVTAFANASYLFNPKETNGVSTFRSRASDAVMSVADQYAARAGVAFPAPFLERASITLAARLEGLPAEDLIGGSGGFRRPGYSVGIEPGIAYALGSRHVVSLSVPYLVRRVRVQNLGDRALSEQRGEEVIGDAAFADYVVIVGISRRF